MANKLLRFAAYCLMAVWILFGTFVYYGRYSGQFYRDHEGAIQAAWESIKGSW